MDLPAPPPQPPVRVAGDTSPPPIVEGIGDLDANTDSAQSDVAPRAAKERDMSPTDPSGFASGSFMSGEQGGDMESGDLGPGEVEHDVDGDGNSAASDTLDLFDVSPGDLSSFAELLGRFETRIDKAATGRKYRELRTAWDDALAEVTRYPDRVDLIRVAESVVIALRIGCESAKVAVVDACLNCTHRLFEYGHLGGAGEATNVILDEREGTLDEIVAVVCGCLEVKEEEVYLRMVQTLLTAATSTKSGLHHGTLLSAVRTIYNIYLNAKMPGTRTTARVSLTQILNLVFARMEAESAEEDLTRMTSSMPAFSVPLPDEKQSDENSEQVGTYHVPCEEGSNGDAFSRDASGHSAGDDADNGGDEKMSPSKSVGSGVEKGGPQDASGAEFSSVLQKDVYWLFRALCKLSAKEVADGLAPDSVGVRSKLLSLELLRSLVNGSGPAFRSGERFVYALRHYLAPSLLSNCMSSSMEVVDVSLDIFEMLLRKETLRPLLKTEIGALFNTVIFRFLESTTAGPARRRRALVLLNRLASDRQTLADLFLNYDCDMESSKIFERVVSVLSSVAETKPATGATAGAISSGSGIGLLSTIQDEEHRMLGLSSLVHVVASLRDWSKPIESAKEEQNSSSLSFAPKSDPEFTGGNRSVDNSNGNSSSRRESDTFGNGSATASGVETADGEGTNMISGIHGTSFLGTVSEGSDVDTTRFEEALKAKRAFEQGVLLFNMKPRKGVEFLVENGRLERAAEAIAAFLRTSEKLDATMVGEYLGEGDSFSVSVMHAYTDGEDFSDMSFDGALRAFLSGFRLPGEAQKIDRILEKFASRFCECNPGIFASAEVAFVLAYSTIMLHTDAHNPMVKKKMTKEEFVRNNRGINDNEDLPYDLLSSLYDRTTTIEIRLDGNLKDSAHDAATARAGTAVAATILGPAERARKFKEESEELMLKTKVLFANRRKTAEDYTYFSATNVYHARLMFEAAWYSMLSTFSVLLAEAGPSDNDAVALCLEGFRNGIAIASTFGMATAKNAFVSSLAKFSHLNSVSEMRAKNVECVRMLLAIAAMEGSNLGEQWEVIVRAISQVEQIRAIASGNPRKFLLQKAPLGSAQSPFATTTQLNGDQSISDASGHHGSLTGKGYIAASQSTGAHGAGTSLSARGLIGTGTASLLSAGSSFTRGRSGSSPAQSSSAPAGSSKTSSIDAALMHVDSKAATVATMIDEAEIERIFVNSSCLSATGVADFCAALCTVAKEELGERTGPRMFCLQKIVEMAYYNMESRTRIQWGKIWDQMGPFFGDAMCHDNRDVAMYGIDALRQLASKFLEKDELSNFSFQRAFLKPFETCFAGTKSVPVRELVLTCIAQIVLARASNIKSGWKSVFSVLALAADDKNESIMNFGFQVVESIVRKYFGEIDEVFVDAVNGIAAYTRSPVSASVALSAIDLLTDKCAPTLANGRAIAAARPVTQVFAKPWLEKASSKPSDGSIDENLTVARLDSSSQGVFTADVEAHIGSWFPILTGLASAIQDERPAVRASATRGLYKVLAEHGGRFASSLWVLVFRGVLLPVFDDVRYLTSSTDRAETMAITEWASSTGSIALRSLTDVFVQHMAVTRVLMTDLLDLLKGWITQENEVVAREGMSVLSRLMNSAGDVIVEEDWQQIVECLTSLFERSMPHEILGPGKQDMKQARRAIGNTGDLNHSMKSGSASESMDEMPADGLDSPDGARGAGTPLFRDKKIDFRVVRAKCVVQLLLIQLVQDTVVSFYSDLTTRHIMELASAVERSYVFAHEFNDDIELRRSLYLTGFMNQIPNLLKQETTGLTVYLRIIFWLYLGGDSESADMVESKVFGMCSKVLRSFIASCVEARARADERREVSALVPVVIFILNGMMQMSNEQFLKHLPIMYDVLLGLVEESEDRLVRCAVSNIFRTRIGSSLGVPDENGQRIEFAPNPQVPGKTEDRVYNVSGMNSADSVASEVQSALSAVSGVRSVYVNKEEGTVHVFTSAPDELLVAAIGGVANVLDVTRQEVVGNSTGRPDQGVRLSQ